MMARLPFLDRGSRRKRFQDDRPSQTYVFALNRQRFDTWCRNRGIPPRSQDIHCILTNSVKGHDLRGFRFRPKDRIIILEAAPLGIGWNELRRDALICSEGWVDIAERVEVWT